MLPISDTRGLCLSLSDLLSLVPSMLLQMALFNSVFFWLHCEACRILIPWPGIKPVNELPLQWQHRLFTPGLLGQSLFHCFNGWVIFCWNSTCKKLRSWHPVPSLQGKQKGKSGSSDRFYFLGSKITGDSDCSHEIKRCFLLGRKAMTHLGNVSKSRDITLLTKVRIFKAMVFQWSCMDVSSV